MIQRLDLRGKAMSVFQLSPASAANESMTAGYLSANAPGHRLDAYFIDESRSVVAFFEGDLVFVESDGSVTWLEETNAADIQIRPLAHSFTDFLLLAASLDELAQRYDEASPPGASTAWINDASREFRLTDEQRRSWLGILRIVDLGEE